LSKIAIEEMPRKVLLYLERLRDGTITPEQKKELFDWIYEHRAMIDLKELSAYVGISLSKLKYHLTQYKKKWRATPEKVIEDTLHEESLKDLKKFTRQLWNEVAKLSTETIMKVYSKAKELEIEPSEFIEEAINFYIEYREYIESMQEKIEDLKALSQVLLYALQPSYMKLMAMRLYATFLLEVARLEAQGIPMPEEFVEDMRRMVDKFLSGLPQEEEERAYEW